MYSVVFGVWTHSIKEAFDYPKYEKNILSNFQHIAYELNERNEQYAQYMDSIGIDVEYKNL